MEEIERVSVRPIQQLIQAAAPKKAEALESLFERLSPVCELDRGAERILFQAGTNPNLIRIGVKCTCRLQAQALAAAVVIGGISTPGFLMMGSDELRKLFRPADQLLTWAVSRDLQPSLKMIDGFQRELETILKGAEEELPETLLTSLNENVLKLGRRLFSLASAYILLHELGHLNYGHRRCRGYWSVEQEKVADSFAAEWLLESASENGQEAESDRLKALFGISVALLWLTVLNVYLGPIESSTHPEGYDRLFQVLNQHIQTGNQTEYQMIWYFVSTMLVSHMWSAGFSFHPEKFQCEDPRDEANYLIDLISKRRFA